MSRTYIAFPIDAPTRDQAFGLINQLRDAPQNRGLRTDFVRLVSELADRGIEFYFVKSLEAAGMGGVKITAARTGLRGFKNALVPLLRGFVMGMDDAQLLRILAYMEDVFVEEA